MWVWACMILKPVLLTTTLYSQYTERLRSSLERQSTSVRQGSQSENSIASATWFRLLKEIQEKHGFEHEECQVSVPGLPSTLCVTMCR